MGYSTDLTDKQREMIGPVFRSNTRAVSSQI
jgi:hypothetical protein